LIAALFGDLVLLPPLLLRFAGRGPAGTPGRADSEPPRADALPSAGEPARQVMQDPV
jgi:hypothetical protein